MPGSRYAKDQALTNIVTAVKPQGMIADEVMPRTASLNKNTYHWQEMSVAEDLQLTDDTVGRTSSVNAVNFSGVERTGTTKDHGLKHVIPKKDSQNAYVNVDPEAMAAEKLQRIVMANREVRVSNIVMNKTTYGANAITLAPADYFTNPNMDAKAFLLEKMDFPLVRPNQIVLGQLDWTAARQNASIVGAILGNSGKSGAITLRQFADLLEVDEVLIGRSTFNVANLGQDALYKRTWSGGLAMLHTDKQAARGGGETVMFGFTPQSWDKVVETKIDDDVGLRGATVVKVGETVEEQVMAPELCSYFVENVRAPA